MIAFSVTCLISAVALADIAPRYPSREPALERVAGFLLLAGLIPIGAGLPLFR